MGIGRRIALLFGIGAKAAPLLAADPRADLERAYWRQVAALQTAQRGIDDVLTGEKRLELEAESLRSSCERATETVAAAEHLGDAERARRARGRESLAAAQRAHVLEEIANVREQRIALERQAEILRDSVETFRTRMHALDVRYALAKARPGRVDQ